MSRATESGVLSVLEGLLTDALRQYHALNRPYDLTKKGI
jgi:hypothetical protein